MKKNNKTSGVKVIYFFIFFIVSLLIAQTIIVCTGDNEGSGDYVILASNDLGMHCIQNDYSRFLILPPANNIHIQIFKKGGEEATPVKQNIDVSYAINNNTTSSDKVNYWDYADLYGFENTPDIGITGNGLSGSCVLINNLYFEATAIPVVPYDDGNSTRNSYQTATITVKETGTNTILAETTVVVVPVSDEMLCSTCHDPGDGTKEDDFLVIHDSNHGTTLETTPKLCADCHKDNALGKPGDGTSPSLSAAMHGFHSDQMSTHPLPDTNPCYSCHPGPETECLRGVMAIESFTCSSTGCHGSMAAVGDPGREAWIDEPGCASTNCHTSTYAPNAGKLYRNSVLTNGPEDMNNKILCVSCHNSPHSEWPSSLSIDNELPVSITGEATYIKKCSACHSGSGTIHGGRNES